MKPETKLLIVGVLLLAGIIVGLFLFNNRSANLDITTQEDYVFQTITHEFPNFVHKGSPVIKIESAMELEKGWYLVDIRSTKETKKDVPVYLILQGKGSDLRVIIGPDTHFTEAEMLQYNVPDSVMKELLS